MKHKVIRLTESQFKEMISMAVQGILKEGIDNIDGFYDEDEPDEYEEDPDWYRDDVSGEVDY